MKMEISQFDRYCDCLPPRYGLMAYGFVKIIAYILTSVFFFASFTIDQIVINSIVCCVILIFSSFLVNSVSGTNTKNYKLFRVYYRCVIGLVVVLSALFLLDVAACIYKFSTQSVSFTTSQITHIATIYIFYVIDLVLEVYLILILRDELMALKSNIQYKFVNVKVDDDSLPEADREETIRYDRLEENSYNSNNYDA